MIADSVQAIKNMQLFPNLLSGAWGRGLKNVKIPKVHIGDGVLGFCEKFLKNTSYLIVNLPLLIELSFYLCKKYLDHCKTGEASAFDLDRDHAHLSLGTASQQLCLYPIQCHPNINCPSEIIYGEINKNEIYSAIYCTR